MHVLRSMRPFPKGRRGEASRSVVGGLPAACAYHCRRLCRAIVAAVVAALKHTQAVENTQ